MLSDQLGFKVMASRSPNSPSTELIDFLTFPMLIVAAAKSGSHTADTDWAADGWGTVGEEDMWFFLAPRLPPESVTLDFFSC